MTLLGRLFGVGALASAIITAAAAPILLPEVMPATTSRSASVEFAPTPRIVSSDRLSGGTISTVEFVPSAPVADTSLASTAPPTMQSMPALFETTPLVVAPPEDERPTGPLYVDTTSRAVFEANRLQNEGRYAEAADIRVIAEQPQAVWINGNETGAALTATISAHRARADAAGQRLVVVTYAIPFRDCGSYSAGGLTAEQYPGWNRTVADALRGSGAIVIVEPDGLTGVTQPECASVAQSRPAMIKSAVETLAAAGLNVYIDAGHSNWVGDAQMADLLTQAGIASARGFATNVSNYRTTADEQAWAQRISDRLGGKRFVIDVSRNGNGPSAEWCNPSGRALGANPTLDVNQGSLDGLLWVKRPGESDGTCNGGPTAGHWWHDYAIGLVRNR